MLFLYNQQNLKNFKFLKQKNMLFLLRGCNFNKFLLEDLIKNSTFFFKYYFSFFVKFLFFFKFKRYNYYYLITNGRISKNFQLQKFDYFLLPFFKNLFFFKIENMDFFSKIIFRLGINVFLYKNFLSKNFLKNETRIIERNFKNFFLRYGNNECNFFFSRYRIFGLGFKIKKLSFFNQRVLSFEIGFGHKIYYILSSNIKCLRRKRHFFIFSTNLELLNNISNHFSNFKKLNPYKIRGLKNIKLNIKMKKGKKQGQRK